MVSSAALPEPLSTQVEDLAKREEDAHEAGPDHEDGENFLLCGPGNVAVHHIGTWVFVAFHQWWEERGLVDVK